jgi:CRP-like cAMP-binding protein
MPTKLKLSGSEFPVRNAILGALLRTEYRRLVGKMEHVELPRDALVYQAGQNIEYVYFPEDAVIAMVDTMHDGRTVGVGTIGDEGMVGINIFLGGVTTPDKAVVQVPGGALRMKSETLRSEIRFGSPLQRVLLQYTQVLLTVISQSVACSQYHTVEQRLARLILTTHDSAHPREFILTHEFIASMLGARRAGISTAASHLRDLGLISYGRGRIVVVDKPGLEQVTCECHQFIKDQYKSLRVQVPRLLAMSERAPAARLSSVDST